MGVKMEDPFEIQCLHMIYTSDTSGHYLNKLSNLANWNDTCRVRLAPVISQVKRGFLNEILKSDLFG